MSRLVAQFQIFRRLMKGKFDAYILWPLAKKFQTWIVDRSTARDFTVFNTDFNIWGPVRMEWSTHRSGHKKKWKTGQIFVAFSKYLNFMREKKFKNFTEAVNLLLQWFLGSLLLLGSLFVNQIVFHQYLFPFAEQTIWKKNKILLSIYKDREHSLVTSLIRVGRGIQDSPKKGTL